MPTIEEKRVYADRTGQSEVYVASETGVVVVTVSDELVGEFWLAHRCDPRDVAAADGQVAVATAEDVLAIAGEALEPTGFGPAVAVDVDSGATDGGGDDSDGRTIVAAAEDGTVSRGSLPDEGTDDGTAAAPASTVDWSEVGTVDGSVTAIDWPFVATDAGLYRVRDGDVGEGGLTTVNDVAATGMPLAATDAGLYKLGNGWMDVLDGAFHAVVSDGQRAHAATESDLYASDAPYAGAADWGAIDVPVTEPVRDIAYTPTATVGVTETGTLLLTAGDGWRTRTLGVGGVVGVAVR